MDFKTLREQRGFMSQRQLAAESGVEAQTISQIELGKTRDLRWSTMGRLAKALRATPEVIADAIADTVRAQGDGVSA